jgi:hypothetical protein
MKWLLKLIALFGIALIIGTALFQCWGCSISTGSDALEKTPSMSITQPGEYNFYTVKTTTNCIVASAPKSPTNHLLPGFNEIPRSPTGQPLPNFGKAPISPSGNALPGFWR